MRQHLLHLRLHLLFSLRGPTSRYRFLWWVRRSRSFVSRWLKLLAPGGRIVFSNNFQKFKLDGATLEHFEVDDITRATIPEDFARNPKIHRAWKLMAR